MANSIIRTACLNDLQAISRLERDCFSGAVAFTMDQLRIMLTNPALPCAIAECGGHVVGYLIAASLSFSDVTIHTFAVNSSFRNQQIGTQLLLEIEQYFARRRNKRIVVQCAINNVSALGFYSRRNFYAKRILLGYYNCALDALELVKDLEAPSGSPP